MTRREYVKMIIDDRYKEIPDRMDAFDLLGILDRDTYKGLEQVKLIINSFKRYHETQGFDMIKISKDLETIGMDEG